jgi:hypothetical protein
MLPNTARTRFGAPPAAWCILAVVVLVELILFVGFHQERWSKGLLPLGRPRARTGEGLVIRCDGLGYYAWLRSLLIDGDWDFDNEFDGHNVVGDWVPPAESRTDRGRRPNQWSVGPALLWAVAVVPGHLGVRALQACGLPWEADGYTLPYQLLVGGASLLASFLGLGLLYGVCRRHARPAPAALAAAFLTLGTGIVFYSAVEVTMAHGIGTAAVAGLVWYSQKTYGDGRPRRWLLVGVLVGLTALVRWQLVTFAVLPAGEALLACRRLRRAGRFPWRPLCGLALAALGAAAAFVPQLVAWRWVYGHWLVTPVPSAHNWLSPSWWRVLASQDRGLMYWTPLALLACAGYVHCRLQIADCRFKSAICNLQSDICSSHEPLALLFGAFVLQVYVLASLWGDMVQLGVSYGFRHLTEALVALGPGLALLLDRAPPRRFRVLCGVGCLLVLWNLLLVAQYRYGLVPAAAGADPETLLANAARLMRRKRALLAGQVLVGPVLLALLARRGQAESGAVPTPAETGFLGPPLYHGGRTDPRR